MRYYNTLLLKPRNNRIITVDRGVIFAILRRLLKINAINAQILSKA